MHFVPCGYWFSLICLGLPAWLIIPFSHTRFRTEVAIEGGGEHPLALRSCNDVCVTSVLDILELFDGKTNPPPQCLALQATRQKGPLWYAEVPESLWICFTSQINEFFKKKIGLISNEGRHTVKNNPSNQWGRDILLLLGHWCVQSSQWSRIEA